jgi:hypothetical protein
MLPVGLEPTTLRLKAEYSTIELWERVFSFQISDYIEIIPLVIRLVNTFFPILRLERLFLGDIHNFQV